MKYEYCHRRHSGEDFCTGLRARPQDPYVEDAKAVFPDANSLQMAVLRNILNGQWQFDIASPRTFSLNDMLDSVNAISSLPDDQWIQEFKLMETLWWTSQQIFMSDYAIGPLFRDPDAKDVFTPPNTTESKQVCNMQRMMKSGNFS